MKFVLLAVLFTTFSVTCAHADNGLNQSDRSLFYHLEEGSEVIPLELTRPLLNPAGQPFMEHLDRFGLILQPTGPDNPEGLPIGITAAPSRDTRIFSNFKMLGVNCAACHVTELKFGGKSTIIDGAPSRFDIEGFYRELADSVTGTLTDPAKLTSYIWRWISGTKPTLFSAPANQFFGLLKSQQIMGGNKVAESPLFNDIVALAKKESLKSLPNDNAAGFLNGLKLKKDNPAPEAHSKKPLLFDIQGLIAKHSKPGKELSILGLPDPLGSVVSSTQSIVQALDLLRARASFLAALAGQGSEGTLGLHGRTDAFGHARNFIFGNKNALPTDAPVDFPAIWGFSTFDWLHYDGNTNSVLERNAGQALGLGAVFVPGDFTSTISLNNIHQLEETARKIQSPKWPEEIFGTLDQQRVTRGKVVWQANCAKCHLDAQPANGEFPNFTAEDIGTDDRRANSFAEKLTTGGEFAVELAKVLHSLKIKAAVDAKISDEQLKVMEHGRDPAIWRTMKSYQARPLWGIWASAPYLHNGSVPSLRALLSKDRPKKFSVGQRDFDPVNVGYEDATVSPPIVLEFDTIRTGNGNSGHLQGTDLPDDQKLDLIEYLKTR